MSNCRACANDNFCAAPGGNYACTRPKGHPGEHVACGTVTHYIHTWSDTVNNSDETYNGWKNRETWALMLHVNNDQGLQEIFREDMRESIREDGDNMYIHADVMKDTADVWFTWSGYYDEMGDVPTIEHARVIEDIGSLWRVDWDEVARHIFDDVDGADIAREHAEGLDETDDEDDQPMRHVLLDYETDRLWGLEADRESQDGTGAYVALFQLTEPTEGLPAGYYGLSSTSIGQRIGYQFETEEDADAWYDENMLPEEYCEMCGDWH